MSNLNNAFKALRKSGYFAKQNHSCCQSCGWATIPDQLADKAVFYHNQDNSNKKSGRPFNLAWDGDGNEIVKILNENNIETEWDGSPDKRIKLLKW